MINKKYKTEKQMKSLAKKIFKNFQKKKSVFLIGKTNEGKTYFIKNFLRPFLVESKVKAKYFKNINEFKINKQLDIAIIDEVEILNDKEFLIKRHPKENPYYTEEYLRLIKKWHKKLSKIKIPCVYIITRNEQKELTYIKKNVVKSEWNNSPILVLEYKN